MEMWFSELHTPDVKHSIRVTRHLYAKRSSYQQIDIFETPEESVEPSIGVPMLTVNGWRKFACGCCTGALYRPVNGDYRKTKLRFVPYYAFGNRGENDMTVWVTKF